MSEEHKDIRDLDVSDEEGEDVKGGVKGPMPSAHNPGKPTSKSPGTATGSTATGTVIPKTPPKGPGRMPPS